MSRAWPLPPLDPDAPLAVTVPRILAVRAAELASLAPFMSHPEAIAELHQARIAAKRLRYTLELFPAGAGDDGERAIALIRDLQDALGLLHDHDVRIALIERELAALPNGPSRKADRVRPGLDALLDRERLARDDCYAAAVERWRALEASGLLARFAAPPGLDGAPPTR